VLTEARDAAGDVMDQQMQVASKSVQAASETIKKAAVKADCLIANETGHEPPEGVDGLPLSALGRRVAKREDSWQHV
jgi:hypothetical protein